MKKNIHPEYRDVAFVDLSINKTFIIASSVATISSLASRNISSRRHIMPSRQPKRSICPNSMCWVDICSPARRYRCLTTSKSQHSILLAPRWAEA